MEVPSSTSSSRRGRLRGFFLALGLSLLVLGLAEWGASRVRPELPLGYSMGEGEAFAVREALRRQDPQEVILGSSRAREAFVAARMAGSRNLAFAAATAEDNHALLRALLRQERPPRRIIYGLSPRQLHGAEPKFGQGTLFWSMDDYRAECVADERACSLWTLPVHNALARMSGLFGLRSILRGELRNHLSGQVYPENPVQGGRSIWHQRGPALCLLGGVVDEARVERYVARLLKDGEYPMGEHQRRHLREMAVEARAAGVELVLVEVPVAPILRRHLPADVYPRFYQAMETLARERGLRWIPFAQLALRLETRDFMDQSHLNFMGAQRFTAALVKVLGSNSRKEDAR